MFYGKGFHGFEAFSVGCTGSILFQCHQMGTGRIAFVTIEPIARKKLMQSHHLGVTCCFGQDGGGGNRIDQIIAVNYGAHMTSQLRTLVTINQSKMRGTG